ncbi:FAD-dependent monooxygenase [Streptomyces sp. RKAG337]|uniref:FAD-dependent monooxygenase n=1 Tax=Streptomyces sp. RKAG337 TaxID=2893404 RepID=UPI002033D7F6|nr:FAD-dependent monooxygenase [Streptomyces sp. RKAG337]MCM2426594.1 FAD-dependent monooxygenase [Streptomyces sp. RKAG337]
MALNSVQDVDVLIAGAGPTGLALAVDLARRGISAHLVEQSDRLFPGSRGKGLQPRTLEVLDDLGVIDAVIASGGPYPLMMGWQDDRRLGEWDLLERFAPTPRAPYGEVWMLTQWRTQEILHERLRELGGAVEFGTALTGITQDADGVDAALSLPDGTAGTVRARFLVAADGGRGTGRRALGVGMTGETIDPHPILIADLLLGGIDRDHWHVWPKAEGGTVMLCPLAGTDHFQLLAQYTDSGTEPDGSVEGIRELIGARTPIGAEQVHEVLWSSAFHPSAAMADRFRVGRVFLAGDAAHIHSPAGGQGLNTSVQDAYNLGWKLGQVLRHGAGHGLLDSYEEERLPIAADVLGLSTRLHGATRDGDDTAARQRGTDTHGLELNYRGGPLTRELRPAALPGGTLPAEAPRAGDRAPDAPLAGGGRLFDLFRGPHFTLLALGTAQLPPGLGADPEADPGLVHAHRIDDAPEHGANSAYAVYGDGLFVVRPDGYLGLATEDPADVAGYLARFTG